jgi:NADH-quinone oxidoreductase subunit N
MSNYTPHKYFLELIHFKHSDFLEVTNGVEPFYTIDHIYLSDLFPYTGEGVIFIGIYTMLISSTFLSTTKYYPVLIDYSTKFSMYILFLASFFVYYNYSIAQTDTISCFFYTLISNQNILGFKLILIGMSILILSLSNKYFNESQLGYFEYNVLFLSSLFGSLILLSANDLIVVYISLEIQALSFYIMSALKKSAQTSEAALKYFIIGSLSSAILLFGMSLIFILTGHHNLTSIQNFLYFAPLVEIDPFFFNYIYFPGLFFGVIFVLSALFIKLAIAPFHGWVADIYEGVLIPTALLFSTVPKIPLFFTVVRFVNETFLDLFVFIQPFLMICCVFSLISGALLAFKQQNIRRFLAYSSVNHFGFILIGLTIGSSNGIAASFMYLFFYMILTFGAWTALICLSYVDFIGNKPKIYRMTSIAELGGLAHSEPGYAFFLVLLFLSMGGIPPLAGFNAKVCVIYALLSKSSSFCSVFENPQAFGFNLILIVVFLSSILSVFYYLKLNKILFSRPSINQPVPSIISSSPKFVLVLGIVTVVNLFSIVLFIK